MKYIGKLYAKIGNAYVPLEETAEDYDKLKEKSDLADKLTKKTEFNIQDISNIFKNINHKASNSPGYDYSFDVYDDREFIGELFYSEIFKEWCFIKDNFPAQRKAYRTDFPIKTIEAFIALFESIGVKLLTN